MIVQSAAAGQPHFVISMAQHTDFAGAMARAFGNEAFEPIAPRDLVLYVIDHHDAGWAPIDAEIGVDPATHLPYNLVGTPRPQVLRTSYGSPDWNERRHPYCGLLSSMHIWGLYNARYGLADAAVRNVPPPEFKPQMDAMLAHQVQRQERLKAELKAKPETVPLADEQQIFQNYKQLQFFDLLALYFNLRHAEARGESSFRSVPRNRSEDATVKITPRGNGMYAFDPFPWASDGIEIAFSGRYLEPREEDAAAMRRRLAERPVEKQVMRFLRA
jgi:8-oxo-dGTP pyrophosphatase MutT (NUDIX family)